MPKVHFNRNPALATSFKFEILGFEEYNYHVQSVVLPGMSMGGVDVPWMNNATHMPSNRIEYDPLIVTWIVDEDFANHSQIRLWMHQIAHGTNQIPENFRDLTLMLYNSNKQPKQYVRFVNAYPTVLTEVSFESGVGEPNNLICTTTFRYHYYDMVKTNEAGRTPG